MIGIVDPKRVDEAAVRLEHSGISGWQAEAMHHPIRWALERDTAKERADSHHPLVGHDGVAYAVDGKYRPDRKRGVRRCDHQRVAFGNGVDHAW